MVQKKKIRKGFRRLVVILLVLIGIGVAGSYIVYDRSLMATVFEKKMAKKEFLPFKDPVQTKAFLEKMANTPQERIKVNPKDFKSKVVDTDFKDIQVITFGDKNTAKHTVMYVHGGGWVMDISDAHLKFCDKLANELDVYVVAPIYKLAPRYTFKESFPVMVDLYKELTQGGKKYVSIMGDSAGGQLTFALAMDIKEKGLPLPYRVMPISPVADVSMTTSTPEEYAAYEETDPMLSAAGASIVGNAYFAGLKDSDYHKNPYYYDNWKDFPKTIIFIGTHEVLYPDVAKMAKKMQEAGVDVTVVAGKNLDHVYAIFNNLPEARKAFEIIKDAFKNSGVIVL